MGEQDCACLCVCVCVCVCVFVCLRITFTETLAGKNRQMEHWLGNLRAMCIVLELLSEKKKTASQPGHEKMACYRLFEHGCIIQHIFRTVVPYTYIAKEGLRVGHEPLRRYQESTYMYVYLQSNSPV